MSVIDPSQFDHITDRVARAKAKAAAIREARAGGAAEQSEAVVEAGPTTAAAAVDAIVEDGIAPEMDAPAEPFVDFKQGNRFRWEGREGEIVGARYDLVHLAYEDGDNHTVVIDRFRLNTAVRDGKLELVDESEAYRPERTGKSERVDSHPFVWVETRKGMTAKKKRPKSIAIINPDGCTGCNACIEVCPTDCIEEVDVADVGLSGIGHYCDVRLEDCVGCVQCVTMCPWDAIEMVKTEQVEKAYEIPVGTL